MMHGQVDPENVLRKLFPTDDDFDALSHIPLGFKPHDPRTASVTCSKCGDKAVIADELLSLCDKCFMGNIF